MRANELRERKAFLIECHLRNVDPVTGEKLPEEDYVYIEPAVSISQINELVENGQPINSLVRNFDNIPDDDDGACDDDDENDRRAEKAFNNAETLERFDDELEALAAIHDRISERQWRESQEAAGKKSVSEPEANSEPEPVQPGEQSEPTT